MDLETFRTYGYKVVDWVADYLADVEHYPVLSRSEPGDIRTQLPPVPPVEGEPMEQILADFQRIIMPGITHWNHPGWFAYFPANRSGPSILAEVLTAGLGVLAMNWQTSPAATELEEHVMDWLRQMLGLPATFRGSIQDTASGATLCALICARERLTGFSINQAGYAGQPVGAPLRVYASGEAHSSVEKDVKLAGFGAEHLVKVPVDEAFAMRPDALAELVAADITFGRRPCAVVATVGTTSSTAIDPLPEIAKVCSQHGLWLHVDAAMAGSAALLPEMRWILDGVEEADSLVFNPHKWLLTNFDCSAFFCRDADSLVKAMSILPEYLKTDQDRRVTNYRDWGIPLGRRFRALKLWFVIRYYGVEGLRRFLREHLAMAREFTGWVTASDRFEVLVRPVLQTVCFRYNPFKRSGEKPNEPELDRLNKALMDAVNHTGEIFLTHTRLGGRFCMRMSIGQAQTKREHVARAWEVLQTQADKLLNPG